MPRRPGTLLTLGSSASQPLLLLQPQPLSLRLLLRSLRNLRPWPLPPNHLTSRHASSHSRFTLLYHSYYNYPLLRVSPGRQIVTPLRHRLYGPLTKGLYPFHTSLNRVQRSLKLLYRASCVTPPRGINTQRENKCYSYVSGS